MTWFAAPALFALLGLPEATLLSLAVVIVVRVMRPLGIGAAIYVALFVAVGVLAG